MRHIFMKFTEHPEKQGETYLQHMLLALMCSLQLVFAATACFIHAFVPFLFTATASRIAKNVVEKRINYS